MNNIILLSNFALPVIVIIYALILTRLISKKPAGSKKMADIAKEIRLSARSGQMRKLKDFAMLAVVLFTAILYAFDWQVAVCFLLPAIVFTALDWYLFNFTSDAGLRLAEAANKKDSVFSLNCDVGAVNCFLPLGSGIIIAFAAELLFFDVAPLLALALGAVFASIYSWRSSKSALAAAAIVTIVLSNILLSRHLSDSGSAKILFSPALLSAGIVALTSASIASKLMARAKKFRAAVYVEIAIFVVLLAVAGYFANRYLLPAEQYIGLRSLFSFLSGLILGAASLYSYKINKIIPAAAIALGLLTANFLADSVGLSLAAVGFASSLPLAIIYNVYQYNSKNAEVITMGAELPADSLSAVQEAKITEIRTKNYLLALTGLLSFSFLAYYCRQLPASDLALSNQKIIVGLLLGALSAYVANTEIFNTKLLLSAAVIIATVAAGLVLGPIYLAAALAGAIAVNLLVGQSAGGEILAAAIISILILSLIENRYSLAIRGIIAAGVALLVVGYAIGSKFYGRRKDPN